eukprot:XP_011406900.1 PREDICTED: uncharacterized protein LOC105314431 [Amphimedon queenslandica]
MPENSLAYRSRIDSGGSGDRSGRSPSEEEGLVEIGLVHRDRARLLGARAVIVATGSRERPVPVPGATLPGVMGLGAVQSMLKSSGLVPDVPVVIAGSGPLVYLSAWQLLRAGASVRALLLTTPSDRLRRAFFSLPDALSKPGDLYKGLRWRREIVRRRVPVLRGVRDLVIEGEERAQAVSFEYRSSKRRIESSLVLLHEGVIANAHLTLAASLGHRWDRRQHALRPLTDDWNRGRCGEREAAVWVAGDCAGVAGASAAVHSGRIAALAAAHHLGRIEREDRDRLARPAFKALASERRFRRFLDRLFEPADGLLRPCDPRTIICRCEEVSVADIERAIDQGCSGPNRLKAFLRCGMGPCQGRMCAGIVSAIFEGLLLEKDEESQGFEAEEGEARHFRIRPPVRPLRLGQLADLETGDDASNGAFEQARIEAIFGEDALGEDRSAAGGESR